MVRKRYSSGQDLKSAARDGDSDGRRGVLSAAVVRSSAGVSAAGPVPSPSVSSVTVMRPRLGGGCDSSECARRRPGVSASVPLSYVRNEQQDTIDGVPPAGGPTATEVLAD